MRTSNKIKFAFFGTPDRAVWALEELKSAGLMPALIVTQPDRPQGRKLILTPPPVKNWACTENIPVLQPEDLSDQRFIDSLIEGGFDAFVVVAYGKILKKQILDIPKRGCLNLHASLLPKLRGSSPIETAILENDSHTGATVILMDELMDHGPILAQKKSSFPIWPITAPELARTIVSDGGKLLAEVLPLWVEGKIDPKEQDHSKATFTRKIEKQDGLIDLEDDGYKNFLKWNAYKDWPGTYFFAKRAGRDTRVIISLAAYDANGFRILKVIPEGKKEMPWEEFKKTI